MKKLLPLYIIFHILFSNFSFSQTPGGVPSGNLRGWFDANTGVTLTGGAVSAWTDRAGIGNATQATAGERPSQTAAAINYNTTLTFDGTNDNLDLADRMATGATGASVFAVAKQTATTGDSWGCIINGQANGPSWTGGGYGLVALNAANTSFGFYVRAYNANFVSFATTLAIPTVMGGVWNGTTANRVEYFQNGGSKGTDAYAPGSVGDNGSTWIGAGDGAANNWSFYGNIAEVIVLNTGLSLINTLRVMSYLAIKYGITLTSNYTNSAGTTLFTTAAPYNSNIIGISRDDQSSLYQKESHNNDDSVRVYLSTLAATNAANTGTATDLSAVILGANTGKLCSSAASNLEIPGGTIKTRIEREWKVTNTAFSSTFSIDIKLNNCAFTSSVNVADLRLLVDDDGNFTNATAYAAGGGLTFSYTNPLLTISGISNTQIASGATKYITIASVASTSPLPVELVSFNANSEGTYNSVNWASAVEVNFKHYELESSEDGVNFSKIATVNPLGNQTSLNHYNYLDFNYFKPITYYRLKMVDIDYTFKYSDVVSVEYGKTSNSQIIVFPNPASDELYISLIAPEQKEGVIEIRDLLGRSIYSQKINLSQGVENSYINTSNFASGTYIVNVTYDDAKTENVKIIINNAN
jgi:hypothetical protein